MGERIDQLPADASPLSTDIVVVEHDPGGGSQQERKSTLAQATAAGGALMKAGGTATGEIVVPDLKVSGLTGATQGMRFVGCTASGAPVSGTFIANDFVIDATGLIFICTAGGSPGSWVQASGSGRELGYAQITANQTGITGVGVANKVAVTGLSINVTVGTRPINVAAQMSSVQNATIDDGVGIAIFDTADLVNGVAQGWTMSPAANGVMALRAECRLAPSAGAHTYAVYTWAVIGGTGQVNASAVAPSWIQATEV